MSNLSIQNKTELTLHDLRNGRGKVLERSGKFLKKARLIECESHRSCLPLRVGWSPSFPLTPPPAVTPALWKKNPGALPSQRKTRDLLKALGSLAGDLESPARELRGATQSIEVDQDVNSTTEACEIIANLLPRQADAAALPGVGASAAGAEHHAQCRHTDF